LCCFLESGVINFWKFSLKEKSITPIQYQGRISSDGEGIIAAQFCSNSHIIVAAPSLKQKKLIFEKAPFLTEIGAFTTNYIVHNGNKKEIIDEKKILEGPSKKNKER